MLELFDLSVAKDGKSVVEGVSVSIGPGKVTALLGAKGAGKSELVLGVAGLLPIRAGRVVVDGQDITGASPDRIRAAGVAAVPEGHQILTQLSVEDNLMAAAALLSNAEADKVLGKVLTTFPELAERRRQKTGTMSGGQQQMLAIGHALMANPRYLLIDEMSLGLAPLIVKRLISDLAAQGIGILLVEQFVEVALKLASHVVVLLKGQIRLSAHPDAIREDRSLLANAYL